jgi:hypothetical protein
MIRTGGSGYRELMQTVKQVRQKCRATCAGADGSQIAELAVSLPLMIVMLVGIMDFGQAFNLKHKLETASREAARYASNQSSADLTNPVPPTVNGVRDLIHNDLQAAQIDDCGLASAVPSSAELVWTYSTTAGCPGTLTVIIDRGSTYLTPGGTPLTVEATHITISYPFQWRFNRVIKLIAPSASYANSVQIIADAMMQNLD